MKKLKFVESPTKTQDVGSLVLPQLSKSNLLEIKGSGSCSILETCGTFSPCGCTYVFVDGCPKLTSCTGTYSEGKN